MKPESTQQPPLSRPKRLLHVFAKSQSFHLLAAALACTLGCLAVTAYLFWPLAPHLDTHHSLSAFGDSQVWCFDHILRMLFGDETLGTRTARAGYPYVMDARFIAWVPALLSIPFRVFLGPLGAYNMVLLLTPALSGLAAFFFLRRVSDASPWILGAMSVTYGLCPYLLSSLANGQIEKAQLWAYPLYLLLLWQALAGPRRGLSLLLIGPVMTAIVFTGPYFGLFIPLVAATTALGLCIKARGQRLKTTGLALVALAMTAAPLLLAQGYFQPSKGERVANMFRNSGPPVKKIGKLELHPSPVAQPATTFVRPEVISIEPYRTHHITYLPKPLLLASFLCLLLGARGRLTGSTLALLGLILAFGPRLVMNDVYQTYNGHPYFLPAELLERLRYPTVEAGQYYRAISISYLGFAILGAAGLSRFRARWMLPLAILLAGATVQDGLKNMQHIFPRTIEKVPGLDALRSMNDRAADGAVLALPYFSSEMMGGSQLMAAAIHGRCSSAVAKQVRPREVMSYVRWLRDWQALPEGDGPAAKAFLSELGFRFIILHHGIDRARAKESFGLSGPELERLFGAPMEKDGLSIWDLGPTELRPQEVHLEPPPEEQGQRRRPQKDAGRVGPGTR